RCCPVPYSERVDSLRASASVRAVASSTGPRLSTIRRAVEVWRRPAPITHPITRRSQASGPSPGPGDQRHDDRDDEDDHAEPDQEVGCFDEDSEKCHHYSDDDQYEPHGLPPHFREPAPVRFRKSWTDYERRPATARR